MANYTHSFDYDKISTLNYNINNATAGQTVVFTFRNMPDNWIGIITRTEDQKIWSVSSLFNNEITCLEGVNTFTFKLDNKEVILTEGAVKQLIQNIKYANDNIKGTSSDTAGQMTLYGLKAYITEEATNAINALDVSPVGATNGTKYIAAISQDNGKITATAVDVVNTYNSTGTKAVSGKAIANAISSISANYVGSDTTSQTPDGIYISGISQTAGVIAATTSSLSPSITSTAASGNNTQKINISVGGVSATNVSLGKATTAKYGVVKLENSVTATDNAITASAVYAALDGFSPCISLKNQPVYISSGTSVHSVNEGESSYSTYEIQGYGIDEDTIIMVTPVYGDSPNKNLFYSKISSTATYENVPYYEFHEKDNEHDDDYFTLCDPQPTWNGTSAPNVYIKNEGPDYSSWEIWSAYGIVCDQNPSKLKELKFYLNRYINSNVYLGEDLVTDYRKQLKMNVNLAIFNYKKQTQE